MSQSDARRRRRQCKRAGRHLAMKTDGTGTRMCGHCGEVLAPPPKRSRGILAEIVPGSAPPSPIHPRRDGK